MPLGTPIPIPSLAVNFCLHWALFTGQGANASPGPPAHPLYSTAKLQALGNKVSGQRAMSSSVMTSLVINWKAKLTRCLHSQYHAVWLPSHVLRKNFPRQCQWIWSWMLWPLPLSTHLLLELSDSAWAAGILWQGGGGN